LVPHNYRVWIDRKMRIPLLNAANTFPAVVIGGPRQVGKTSLLEHAFPKHRYVTLDLGEHADMAETRPADFLSRFPPPLIVDEVQYAPALFRHLKVAVDTQKGEVGLFLLSGSQDFALMESVSDSLAGRAAVIRMLGLSGHEWRASPVSDGHAWPEFLFRGGYPGLWASDAQVPERSRWYASYLATYLERDVRNMLRVGSLRDFERFLRACAARTAQTLNMAELGRDVGISANTAREWISVLQASNQIALLEPYYRSLGKRLVKSPKLYFTDTGLAAFLLGFQTATTLWTSQAAGALWENYVITQWIRWRDWEHPEASLWYYRDQVGAEVDLLIEQDAALTLIECKLASRPDLRDLRGISAVRKHFGKSVKRAFIACTSESTFSVSPDTTAVPGWTTWDV
jgi:uncharacterized protein